MRPVHCVRMLSPPALAVAVSLVAMPELVGDHDIMHRATC